MLQRGNDIYCGIFDSTILRRDDSKSQNRTVVFFELELFHNNEGVSYVEQKRYPCRRGMLLCAKPGQVRHSDFPVRCSFIRVAAGKDAEIDRILSGAPDCFYIEDEGRIEELMALFTKLGTLSIGTAARDWDTPHINAKFCELLYRLMRLWQEQGESAAGAHVSRLTREAYEYINEHFCEDCSLATLAGALHISPNYLHTVFRQETGQTPFEYVLSRRVEKAKKLIMAGEKSMLEIAMETGFSSQSHFNKIFKKETGRTPVAYRRDLAKSY